MIPSFRYTKKLTSFNLKQQVASWIKTRNSLIHTDTSGPAEESRMTTKSKLYLKSTYHLQIIHSFHLVSSSPEKIYKATNVFFN
jgi:hypothetical protein